ncbi:MAG: chemotaxis protein CheW [Magnetococcus sp. WYHC-3]
MDETIEQVLQFRVGPAFFCLDVRQIHRAILLTALEPLPGAPHWVAGLLNDGGESMIALDPALWLGLGRQSPYDLGTPMLLCHTRQGPVCLIVDEIDKVRQVSAEDWVTDMPAWNRRLGAGQGVRLSRGLAFLLDPGLPLVELAAQGRGDAATPDLPRLRP